VNPWVDREHRLRAWIRFLLGALVVFAANFVGVGMARAAAHGHDRLLEAIYRPLTMVLLLAGFALLLITADRLQEGVMRAMGLGRFSGWAREAWLGIAIGAALVCAAVLWIAVAGSVKPGVHLTGRSFSVALLELVILASGAMAEELMFRGYPFQRLVEAMGPVAAVPVMSVLFGLAHGGNPHASKLALLNTFIIGVLFCVAYLRTRALWLPWGMHFAWNTVLGVVFGLPVSGLTDFAVIVRTRASGPRWVTGGAYGIEASVVGTAVILLGFIPVILLTRKGSQAQAGETPVEAGTSASDQPAERRIQP
jgi:CAAX protease family protein